MLAACSPQSIANREDSFASVGACGSFEVALQWLNVLYARECRPAALAEAAAGEAALNAGGAAGQQGMAGAATSSGGQRSQAQGAAAAGQYEATLLALLETLSNAVPPTHPASKAVTRCAAGASSRRFGQCHAGAASGRGLRACRGMANLHS